MIIKNKIFFFTILQICLSFFINNVSATCLQNPKIQKERSNELQQLQLLDQHDREGLNYRVVSKNDWNKISQSDALRRKRVAEIFAEGYLQSSEDYLAAALIYQHGELPEHFYQAYIWASKAAELGDNSAHNLAALTIDRYLISIEKKQLFGSQALIKNLNGENSCFCLQQYEESFPDSLRESYSGYTLKKRLEMYATFFNMSECKPLVCTDNLNPTPKNSVPGLW